jgi:hypothetical protein
MHEGRGYSALKYLLSPQPHLVIVCHLIQYMRVQHGAILTRQPDPTVCQSMSFASIHEGLHHGAIFTRPFLHGPTPFTLRNRGVDHVKLMRSNFEDRITQEGPEHGRSVRPASPGFRDSHTGTPSFLK